MKELKCLRCGAEMEFIGTENLQLSHDTPLAGVWNNVLSGALKADIYICASCGKMELFAPTEAVQESQDHIAQVTCPHCGMLHDLDDVVCPHCHKRL